MKKSAKSSEKKAGSRKLSERAGIAMKNGFYLETTWILSTLFARRLTKIALLAGNTEGSGGRDLDLLLRNVRKQQLTGRGGILQEIVSPELTDRIRLWKNNRNRLWKHLAGLDTGSPRFKRIAEEGIILFKELNQAYKELKARTDGGKPGGEAPDK